MQSVRGFQVSLFTAACPPSWDPKAQVSSEITAEGQTTHNRNHIFQVTVIGKCLEPGLVLENQCKNSKLVHDVSTFIAKFTPSRSKSTSPCAKSAILCLSSVTWTSSSFSFF